MQQTISLPESQVVLCFSQHQPVVQLPASICLNYFPREDDGEDRCAPVKITISIGHSDWREFSLTLPQVRKMLYFLRKVITKRSALPERRSDDLQLNEHV